jgi:hypothetical protein
MVALYWVLNKIKLKLLQYFFSIIKGNSDDQILSIIQIFDWPNLFLLLVILHDLCSRSFVFIILFINLFPFLTLNKIVLISYCNRFNGVNREKI